MAAWSAAIESLLDSPERARELGAQAHHDVAAITAAAHLQAFDRIISQARGPRPPCTSDTTSSTGLRTPR